MKRITIFLVGLALMLTPVLAFAQNSTCEAYNAQLCNESGSSETTTSGPASSRELPFTGLDVALLAAGGGLFLVGGILIRARLRRMGSAGDSELSRRDLGSVTE